ncbi:hypothetical protein ACFL5O_03630 [Myxococcota bacterium]
MIDETDEAPSPKKGHRRRKARQYPPQRKWRQAKNGRDDVPQIVLGLAATRDGYRYALGYSQQSP